MLSIKTVFIKLIINNKIDLPMAEGRRVRF